MKNKKIVIITTNFANGGTERRAMVLANGFSENGYDVTYLVMNKIYPDVVYSLSDKVKLVAMSDVDAKSALSKKIKLVEKQIETKLKRLNFLHRICKILKINDICLRQKISVLKGCKALRAFIMENQSATYVSFGIDIYEKVVRASEGLSCNLIFTDVSSPDFKKDPKKNEIFEHVLSKSLKKADACIFQTKEQMAYYGKCVAKNGQIIKNPITVNLPDIYIGERKHIIVNFCRTHPVKNLLLLVDAFKLFSEKFPDYRLEIYGATSTITAENYKAEVEKQIVDLGLKDKAIVFNAIPDIHEKIFDYSMFVSSSDSEGLSNSMLEAMAMGLPCVCTDCEGGGPRDVITNGENGLIVPIRDAKAMCDAMCSIAEDKHLQKKLSSNAEKIRTELSVENIVKKWINVIES